VKYHLGLLLKHSNACFFTQIFSALFSSTLFKEMAKHSILVAWEDVTIEELMEFHDVILKLNLARCMKCPVQDFISEQCLDSLHFYKDVFLRKRFLQFCSYIANCLSTP
jgi:hypothetical protein